MDEADVRRQKNKNGMLSCIGCNSSSEDDLNHPYSTASSSHYGSHGSTPASINITDADCNIIAIPDPVNVEEEITVPESNYNLHHRPPSPNWEQINQERKKRLEEALRHAEEIKERKKRQREELALERKKRMHEMIVTLISSLTHPLYEETRKFNEWVEQPD